MVLYIPLLIHLLRDKKGKQKWGDESMFEDVAKTTESLEFIQIFIILWVMIVIFILIMLFIWLFAIL